MRKNASVKEENSLRPLCVPQVLPLDFGISHVCKVKKSLGSQLCFVAILCFPSFSRTSVERLEI